MDTGGGRAEKGTSDLLSFWFAVILNYFHLNLVKWLLQTEKPAAFIPCPSSYPSLDAGTGLVRTGRAGLADGSWAPPCPPPFLTAQQASAKSDKSVSGDHRAPGGQRARCGQQLENAPFLLRRSVRDSAACGEIAQAWCCA